MTHAEWCHWGICAEPNHCICDHEEKYDAIARWDMRMRRQAAHDLRDLGAVEEILEKVQGQDSQKTYSVGEVKELICPLVQLLRDGK